MHKARGRASGRGPTTLQPWEFFLLAASLHALNPDAVRGRAVAHIAKCGHGEGEAAAIFEQDVQAARRCIPAVESWPAWADALQAVEMRQSVQKLMQWFLMRSILDCGDEDRAQQMLPQWIESATVAAAATVGVYGPADRWPTRRLPMSPPMATTALSVGQWAGLSVKDAAAHFGVKLSTAYRLLGKKPG